MKRCIIDIEPHVFRQLLQLPEGALIEDVRVSYERCGVLEIRMSGCGWETPEGYILKHSKGTVEHDGLIMWDFEFIGEYE